MSEQNNAGVNPELVIEDLLEEIKRLTKEKTIQMAANKQLQAESRLYLQHAANLEAENKDLKERLEKIEDKIANFAGPVPVGSNKNVKMPVVEAEIVEA